MILSTDLPNICRIIEDLNTYEYQKYDIASDLYISNFQKNPYSGQIIEAMDLWFWKAYNTDYTSLWC